MTDHWLVDKFLSKNDPLITPFHALLCDGAHPADHCTGHSPPLVVEVAHDDDEAVVFFAEEMVDGHFHVVKLDKGRCCGCRVARFYLFGLHIVVSRDEDDGKPLLGL